MKIINYIILILCIILLAFYSGYKSNNQIIYINNIDTIYKIKYDTLIIFKKGKIKYINDSTIVTKPFITSLDTNIENNEINIDYTYPENTFRFYLTRQDTNYIYKIHYSEINNNCLILTYASGVLSGSLLYYLINRL